MSFTAEYHGTCSLCDDPIVPGQAIRQQDDEWIHDVCGSRADTAPCVCEKCWLVHTGECF
jgi:hypothetical protein